MIKIGIAGAQSELAGDLLRLLVHHPEVDIISPMYPGHGGTPVSAVHYGLLGEQNITFSDSIDLSRIDVLFVCGDFGNSLQTPVSDSTIYPKIIDMTGFSRDIPVTGGADDFVFGLSEIYRKSLVRGATRARLPLPTSSAALIALYPLARNLMLNTSLNVEISSPALPAGQAEISSREIIDTLSNVQYSFSPEMSEKITFTTGDGRGIHVRATVECMTGLQEIEKLFLDVYDDHNFTILTRPGVGMIEVLGTDRVVVTLRKDESSSTLTVEAFADERKRGSAAEGVHIMNLMFGLHEKTGLDLIPTGC